MYWPRLVEVLDGDEDEDLIDEEIDEDEELDMLVTEWEERQTQQNGMLVNPLGGQRIHCLLYTSPSPRD